MAIRSNHLRAVDARPGGLEPAVLRQARQRYNTIVRDIPIPVPFDEQRFCDVLGTYRGRAITLRAVPLRELISAQDIVYGFVTPEQHRDVLYYERDTHRYHQRVIIAHEIAHLLLEHQPGAITQSDLLLELRRLAPGAPIGHIHQRNSLRTREECEAEIFATLLVERISQAERQGTALSPAAHDPARARLTQRLAADLEGN